MLSFKHKIIPDPEVVAILVTCTEFVRLEDGRAQARVDERLEGGLAPVCPSLSLPQTLRGAIPVR